jgi:hypothetical protein
MTSLLPKPHGQGVRNNEKKRNYVWENLSRIEYRTLACRNVEEARAVEARMRAQNSYAFPT